MSRIPQTPQTVAPDRQDEIQATSDRGRRWYHLRPKPRRRSDLWGFSSGWWMALATVVVIFVAIYPVPWW